MGRDLLTVLVLVLFPIVGCSKQEEIGENRSGRFGCVRYAKQGELKQTDLPGTYVCEFRASTRTLVLGSDGTWTFEIVDKKTGDRTAFGPGKWHVQLDIDPPQVYLDRFPPREAGPSEDVFYSKDDLNAAGLMGFNERNDLVIGLGADPDHASYYCKESRK